MNPTDPLDLLRQDHVDAATIRDAFANNKQLLRDIFNTTTILDVDLFCTAVKKHPVDVLHALLDVLGSPSQDFVVLQCAVDAGKDEHVLALLQHELDNSYGGQADILLQHVLDCDIEEVVNVLLASGMVPLEDSVKVLGRACVQGKAGVRMLTLMKSVWKENPSIFFPTLQRPARVMVTGSFEVMQYLVAEGVVFPPASLRRAFESRNIEFVRWVCERVEENKAAETSGAEVELSSDVGVEDYDTPAAVFAAAADAPASFWLKCVGLCEGEKECRSYALAFVTRLLPVERLRTVAEPLLRHAIRAGRVDVAKRLLEKAPEECVRIDSKASTLGVLEEACAEGEVEVVKLLLDAGVPLTGAPRRRRTDDLTPLGLALKHGHRLCADLLLVRAELRGERPSLLRVGDTHRKLMSKIHSQSGPSLYELGSLKAALDALRIWVERRDVEMCRTVWGRFGELFASAYEGQSHPTFAAIVDAVLQNEEPEKAEEMATWLSETPLAEMAAEEHMRLQLWDRWGFEGALAASASWEFESIPTEFAQLERGLRLWPDLLGFRRLWADSLRARRTSLLRCLVECDRVHTVTRFVESEDGQRFWHMARPGDGLADLAISATRSVEMLRLLLRTAARLGQPIGFGAVAAVEDDEFDNWRKRQELMDVYFNEVPQTTADLRKLHVTAHRYGLWEEVMSAAIAFGHLDPRDDDAVRLVFREADLGGATRQVVRHVRFLLSAGASPWALARVDMRGTRSVVDDAQQHARLFQVLVGLNVGGSETALGRMKAHSLFDMNVLPIVAGFLRRDASKAWKHLAGVRRVQAAPTGSLAAFVPDDVLRSAVRPSAEDAFTFEVDVQQALAARAAPGRGGGGEVAVAEPEQPAWSFDDGAAFEPDVGSFGGPLVNPFEVDSSAPSFGSSAAPAGDDSAAPFSFSFSSIGGNDDSANPPTLVSTNPFEVDNSAPSLGGTPPALFATNPFT